MMAPTNESTGQGTHRKTLGKSASLDSIGAKVETLGEDSGWGRILLGLRYQTRSSSLEVHVVKGEGIRGLETAEISARKPSTYCTVAFQPDQTEPVSTEKVENSDCPRWQGAFRFEKFPLIASAMSQRCLQVQVHDASTRTAISEATLLLDNWGLAEFEKGVRVWKHLCTALETQRAGDLEGSACLTLLCRPDRLKLTLHRIEGLKPRWIAAKQAPEFNVKLQAAMSGRVTKEVEFKGFRALVGGDVNFYDAEFSVGLGKHSRSIQCLALRLVVTHRVDSVDQEIGWLDLGTDVKRQDCCCLFQTMLDIPNKPHDISVRLSRPPIAPPLGQRQGRPEA